MRYCTSCGESLNENIRCEHCLSFDRERLNAELESYYYDTELSDESNSMFINSDTFVQKVRQAYPRLERAAIDGTKIDYESISGNGIGVHRRGYYLGAVGVVEHHDNRPLLPSVVVQSENGDLTTPGEGYYNLAEYLGVAPDVEYWAEEQKEEWWRSNLTDVHSFWTGRDYSPPNSY